MDDRAQLLIAGHLTGSLTPEEGAELVRLATTSIAVRDELAAQTTMHRWLRLRSAPGLDADAILKALPQDRQTAERVLQRLPRRAQRRTVRRTTTVWWGAAAAALVLIIALVWQQWPASGDGFQVQTSRGDNTLAHAGRSSAVVPSARLIPGDVLKVADAGVVTLQAGDGSTLVLDAAASLAVLADRSAGVELELQRGRALATVTPRAGERNFTIRTPYAVVVVIGTRFTVSVDANHTSLDVAEGRVRFTPLGEATRVVAAGESAAWPVTPAAPSTVSTPRIVDLIPVADADADEARPSASFGGESTLRLVGMTPGKERVSLLRFALPFGRITRAELLLHHLAGSGTIQVCQQAEAGNWQENDLRFYHLPPRGPVRGTLREQAGLWSCDVTAAVRAGTLEFMLVNATATEVTFASREDTSHAPILRLTMADMTTP